MEKIVVDRKDAGARIDKYLAGVLADVSRARIQQYIENGAVSLNGKVAVKKQLVEEDDIIEHLPFAECEHPAGREPLPQDIPLEMLYEDEWLCAVDKPAGLVVHPGHGVPDGTLVNALLFHEKKLSEGFSKDRPGIVHRLDKDTSGVVLVAKKDSTHARLAAAFAGRLVKKQYLAFCIGKPVKDEGCIDLALERSRREPIKRTVSDGGKNAQTSFRLEQYRSGISLITFFPYTGRTHQIRVHASASGFPILADSLYGGSRDRLLRITPVERPFAFSIFKCFSRQALHAQTISFVHPETHDSLTITAPLPEDFRNALRLFG